jgi:alkylation response protein AidB-like acyl-CoA dehydrogenase
MEEGGQYAKTFGIPIAGHRREFLIADMAKDIEAGRDLVYQAAWMIDNSKRNTKFAAMAKAFCADIMRVATDAVQVFGGYGYSTNIPSRN